MPYEYTQTMTQLKQLGTPVQEFNQGARLKEAKLAEKAIATYNLNGGYCAGVCIDWIRRSLLGGKKTGGTLGPSEGKEERKHDNVVRMVSAWEIGAREKTFVSESSTAKLRNTLQQILETSSIPQPLTCTYPSGKKVSFKEAVKLEASVVMEMKRLFYLEEPGWYLSEGLTSYYAERGSVAGLVKQLEKQPLPQQEATWADFALDMDNIVAKQRKASGRKDTSRPFQGIAVFKTFPAEQFPADGGGQWMTQLLKNAFHEGCCTFIDFGLRVRGSAKDAWRESGHAVAVQQLHDDKLWFLDPNYGVFQYDKKGVQMALQYLFWATLDGKKDPPHYGFPSDTHQVTNKVGYVLFGRTGAKNPFEGQ